MRTGQGSRQCLVKLLGEGQIERFRWHGGRHASGVERVHRLRKLLELFAREPVAKVRSRFDELRDHDRPTADIVDDVSAPTADWRDDELITGIAELSSRFVIRGDVTLAIATHTHPPRTGSVAPAIAAGGNERRSQLLRAEFG